MPTIHLLLAGSSYGANGLALATGITAAVILLLGVAVLIRARLSLPSVLFVLITIGASGWLASFSAMYSSVDGRVALFWARSGHLFASLIAPSVYQFASIVVRRRRKREPLVIAAWVACGAVGIVGSFTSFLVPAVQQFLWGFYPIGTIANIFWVSLYGVIIAASVRMLWRAYRDAEGRAREQAGLLVVAFCIGAVGLIDYLPTAGIDVYPVGFMAALLFVVVATIAVWRYRLVDITPEYAASQILETMKGAVVVVDMAGKIRVVNRAACTMLGFAAVDLIGNHIRQILQPDDNLSTGQLLNSMGVLEQNMVWRGADGGRIDVLASSSFVREADGTPAGVVYVASDFTERKRAEQALRESEHRYRTLFEANPLPMWVYDFETLRFTAVNETAVLHYGYSHDEFLRMTILEIRPAEDVPSVRTLLRSMPERRERQTVRHQKKDGSIIDAEITSFEFFSGGRSSRLVIARDVTERQRAEALLRESEERYRSLVELSPDAILVHMNRRITFANTAAVRLFGARGADQLIGIEVSDLVHPDFRNVVEERIGELASREHVPLIEEKFIRIDGVPVEVEVAAISFTLNGRRSVQVVARDITERKAIEERYRLLFERNLAGVYRITLSGLILDCNDALARIFGYDSRRELLDQTASSLYFDEDERMRHLELLREQGSLTNHEIRMRRRDGTQLWALENVTLLEGHGRETEIMEGTLIDISDRKRVQEQMEYQAYHDVLTDLPNRLLFRDRITVALAHARRMGRGAAVMFLDLDQFKLVNDTLGHTVGDNLLQAIAARIVQCVRAGDTVARMGGDEFTILLADIADSKSAVLVAQKVLDAVCQPVMVDGHELFVTTSIGIAIFPEDGVDAETLLRNADRAMYRAKENGRNNYQYATPSGFEAVSGRLSLERSLHHAFEREEFELHYQPLVDIGTGRVVGAEALIRWNHPDLGLLEPDSFIPIAEESGLIRAIGEWVLRTACTQMKRWHDDGHDGLRIAVNLSPRQFQQRDLAATVQRVLEETGFPARMLDLEITETAAMQNAELSLAILKKLKGMGIRISIDDFGTGHSSLAYLKRFPIDTVKIDQHFVRDLHRNSSDGAIVAAVIAMARALNLRVIAEGVETEEQLAFLQRERCEEMQGFLYGRPVPAAQFEMTLAKK